MDILNRVFVGDALTVIKIFPESFINCVVTSPPYWKMRDYEIEFQIGQENSYEEYIDNLISVFREVKRVLRDDGTLWVNIGDKYQDKTLLMIPERFAIRMIDDGWKLRNVIIWKKKNPVPSSAKDRFTVDYEYVYFFTKSGRYYFKQIREELSESTLKRVNYGHSRKNKIWYNKYAVSADSFEKYREKVKNGELIGRNKRCVWEISHSQNSSLHFAPYPEELVEIILTAGCPENGVVLDPFVGSGTTLFVAKKMGINYIGIDINPDYVKIAEKRVASIPSRVL